MKACVKRKAGWKKWVCMKAGCKFYCESDVILLRDTFLRRTLALALPTGILIPYSVLLPPLLLLLRPLLEIPGDKATDSGSGCFPPPPKSVAATQMRRAGEAAERRRGAIGHSSPPSRLLMGPQQLHMCHTPLFNKHSQHRAHFRTTRPRYFALGPPPPPVSLALPADTFLHQPFTKDHSSYFTSLLAFLLLPHTFFSLSCSIIYNSMTPKDHLKTTVTLDFHIRNTFRTCFPSISSQ